MSKIFNDPVYGFVTIPQGILFELIEHPWFQRLRRISQLGLTGYVYPGALHTRFHHALGALHLMLEAIEALRSKEVEITTEEQEAACIAILLHDIGHGPFSHALEHTLVDIHHEELSLMLMEHLNVEFDGKLSMAISIFKDVYPKKFLHQLVSGQLDMDRMDYLNRDSFFTGVSEGVIGYHRIIKMLDVKDGGLVVEEKGIYSIENFLIARRLMYWQVYLHKTAVCAEKMLIQVLRRAKELAKDGWLPEVSHSLAFFFDGAVVPAGQGGGIQTILHHFSRLDDNDIYFALKQFADCDDPILSYLSTSLLNRKLLKIELQNTPFESDYIQQIRLKIRKHFGEAAETYLLISGTESNRAYNDQKDEIRILYKDGKVLALSENRDYEVNSKVVIKYYICYPKNLV
jgi:HD superfamily phosphohydrolase